MMITTITGSFEKFGADIEAQGEDLNTAKVEFWAHADSITTNNAQRDGHLKSVEFFDAAKHPKVTFSATRSESVDHDGSWTLYGDLSTNGIAKPVKFALEWGGVMKDPYGNTKAGVSIHGKINRKDWGVNWNTALGSGGVLVSDEVRIACEVQLVKQG